MLMSTLDGMTDGRVWAGAGAVMVRMMDEKSPLLFTTPAVTTSPSSTSMDPEAEMIDSANTDVSDAAAKARRA